jgi:ABC-type Fe3+/spermidine/putrescine transport system ATPase subunit
MKQIFNGGLEAGLLRIVSKDTELSQKDKARLEYLESLPKNKWVTLDENGLAISDEQARENERKELQRFTIKNDQP